MDIRRNSNSLFTGQRAASASLIFIAAVALLAYSRTFSSPFHFDDTSSIVDNYALRDFGNFWPPSGTRSVGFLSFALNYHLGGLKVFGYHLFNIAVHIGNGILVWRLVVLTFLTPRMERLNGCNPDLKYLVALSSSLIFVAHPVQTQAVTYIVQRFTSLAAFLYLLSLVFYVRARVASPEGKRPVVFYSLSVLSAVLAMKTKEISFTLPLMAVLYEVTFFDGKYPKRFLYLLPLLLTIPVIPLTLTGVAKPLGDIIGEFGEVSKISPEIPRMVYFFTELRVIVTYIRLLCLPVNQNMDYDYPVFDSFYNAQVFLSAVFLFSIIVFSVWFFVRSRKNGGWGQLASFGVFWFFLALSVESSFIPIRDVIFEHRLYLPGVGASVAFSSALVCSLDVLARRWKVKNAAFLTVAVIAATGVLLAAAAYARNLVWQSHVALWEDVVRKSPDKARGHNNLGISYEEINRLNDAAMEYKRALEIYPYMAFAHYNIGNVYDRQKRADKAIEEYKKAIELFPDFPGAHNNLGDVYAKGGRLGEAVEEFRKAIEANPGFAEAYNNLGNIHDMEGRAGEAMEEYEKAIKIRPDFTEAHYNLGNVYDKAGRSKEAVEEYLKTIELDPGFAEAYNNLGNIHDMEGRAGEAMEEYEKAIKIRPDFAEAHYNLGNVYDKAGRSKEAVEEYLKTIELDPGFAEAYNNLGNIHARAGRTEDAVRGYRKAIELDPKFVEAHNNLGNVYGKEGRTAEAMEQYEKAIKIRQDFADAHYNIGLIYMRKGLKDMAGRHFKKAFELNPGGYPDPYDGR